MNILVFSWRDPKHPLAGGAEQVMHEHMKGWVAAGHKVTLFSSHFKGGAEEENLDGVLIKRQGFQLLGVHLLGAVWYLFGQHPTFDLVVDQFHGIPFFTPLYVVKPKLAVIQETAREVWFLNHLLKPINWIVGIVGYLAEPLFFMPYKRIPFMTGSTSAKKDLTKFGIKEKNITVVPHGVILTLPKKIPQKEKINTVVFLGALTRDKGIEDAIKCFSILNKKGRLQFWVIGKGDLSYLNYLKKLTRKLQIERNTEFFGFVPDEKKFELLAKAHVLVNPSVREGWGLVNIEANSVGTPVVAYRSLGLIDSVKEGKSGTLCKTNTSDNLAENVFNLLKNKTRYDKLQKNALSWSKAFSWEKSKKKSLLLIEQATR